MHDGNTKMVSIAHALSKVLGSDSEKYEKAMKKRLKLESQEGLPSDFQEYREEEIRTAVNDMRSMDLEDPWVDLEGKQPIKRRERKLKRKTDKERTLKRKKQRERKVVHCSFNDLPVYGYAEDWEDDALNGRR